MADEKKTRAPTRSSNIDFDGDEDFNALERAGRKGLFGRFNEALQSSRGPQRKRDPVAETRDDPHASADDLAIRRARNVSAQKMVIPEGVIVEGSLTGGPETEVSGRVEGNITVDGRLYLGASALVSGNVRAASCKVEGLVEGQIECSDDLELTQTGRLNADVIAGKRIHLAGEVSGNVMTPGLLRLAPTCKVTGDIRTRKLLMEEGASLNGHCAMRTPAQQSEGNPK